MAKAIKTTGAMSFATIKHSMEKLGTWRDEYESAARVLADRMKQYDELSRQFAAGGYECEIVTATGRKKAPIVATLEALSSSILAWMGALGLTPTAARKMGISSGEEAVDPLAALFAGLNGNDGT